MKDANNGSEPKPEDLAADLAGGFFTDFSKDHPGTFPGVAEFEKDGKTAKTIGPVKEGSDIQSLFFDLWLQEHPDAELEPVPADMVMSSGSGLDPDITLSNATWQLDNRVAAAWAKKTGTTDEKECMTESSGYSARRAMRRWSAWSACRWSTCLRSISPSRSALGSSIPPGWPGTPDPERRVRGGESISVAFRSAKAAQLSRSERRHCDSYRFAGPKRAEFHSSTTVASARIGSRIAAL